MSLSRMRRGCGLHIGLCAGFVIHVSVSERVLPYAIGALFSGGIGHVRRHLMVVLVTINKVRK